MNKEVRKLCKAIREAGGEVQQPTRGGHFKIYTNGTFLMSMSCSPASDNGPRIAARQLRKMGLPVQYG